MSAWVDVVRGIAWLVCIVGGAFFALIIAAGFIQQVIDWVRRGQ